MMSAAILSVTAFGVVMLTVGFVCGAYAGQRQARIHALNQCIDWAALAMKGNPVWRRLTVADALLKAGTLIGGNDVMPPVPIVRQPLVVNTRQPAVTKREASQLVNSLLGRAPRPEFTKGSQV